MGIQGDSTRYRCEGFLIVIKEGDRSCSPTLQKNMKYEDDFSQITFFCLFQSQVRPAMQAGHNSLFHATTDDRSFKSNL